MQLQMKGPRAVLVLVVVLGFGAWRSFSAHTDLDTGAAQELSRMLQAEYARTELSRIGGVEDLTPEAVADLLATQNVTFTSLTARGTSDDMIVRAEVAVDGREPQDGAAVRYYRMSHSVLTGWRVSRETSAWAYYTKLF